MAKIILKDLSTQASAKRTKASRFDIFEGVGSPEGIVVGKVGDLYIRKDGGPGTTIYFKESGHNTNTGWNEKGTGGSSGWLWEETFVASSNQTTFALSNDIEVGNKITVQRNGVELDMGESEDYILDYDNNLLIFNYPLFASSKIKIRRW